MGPTRQAATETARPAAPASRQGLDWSGLAARYGTVLAALIIFVVFALANDRFLSVNTISNILVQISVLMIVSSGLTVAVASGEFDLSVGQVASLSGVLVAGLLVWAALPVAAAIALAVLAGVAIGLVNGLLVTRLRSARRLPVPIGPCWRSRGMAASAIELATAARHDLGVVAVVFDDGAFGNVRRIQQQAYGNRLIASDLRNPDFARFAESFGIGAYRAKTPADLQQALERAFRDGGPALVHVPVGEMPSIWDLTRVRGEPEPGERSWP